ncbi:hypothetical protein TNIN_434781 [Trichonephila inaurata madagascariensis]|uniref:Uncharacterized protein n=1 Tax=Trichonephila inaurata madagascariensis TaxID=2747483 RepID=A0A8X7CU98_9ARAC|nr:hypothetical protein TNIN_434781 [Trichonephila inaurata madagascariensis]
MVVCFQGVGSASQHSPNRHMAHICGSGYSPRARLRLLLEFIQHMLFKFRYPRTPGTLCVVYPSGKRVGFSETSMQAFESFSVRQASRRKSFPVQSLGLQGIPIHNAVNEIDNSYFL